MTDTTQQHADMNGLMAAADAIVTAFGRHDRDTYFAGFAPEATFLFYTLEEPLASRAAYQQQWQRWEEEDGFRVHACRSTDRLTRIVGDTGIFVHRVETDLEMGGERLTSRERETIVFRRTDAGGWLAIHEHLSAG